MGWVKFCGVSPLDNSRQLMTTGEGELDSLRNEPPYWLSSTEQSVLKPYIRKQHCFIVSAYIVEFSLNISFPVSLWWNFFPCEFLNSQWADSITFRMYEEENSFHCNYILRPVLFTRCVVTGNGDMVLHLLCAMGSQKVPRSPVSRLYFLCRDLNPILVTPRDDLF